MGSNGCRLRVTPRQPVGNAGHPGVVIKVHEFALWPTGIVVILPQLLLLIIFYLFNLLFELSTQ